MTCADKKWRLKHITSPFRPAQQLLMTVTALPVLLSTISANNGNGTVLWQQCWANPAALKCTHTRETTPHCIVAALPLR